MTSFLKSWRAGHRPFPDVTDDRSLLMAYPLISGGKMSLMHWSISSLMETAGSTSGFSMVSRPLEMKLCGLKTYCVVWLT